MMSDSETMHWNFENAVKYIYDIPKFTKKGGIEQTRGLMALIGNPQNDFKYIHVAGTNGKGSVSAFLSNALQACGQKTGLFTSPHLVCINERIRIDGEMISDEDFVDVFEYIKNMVDDYVSGGGVHPTFFEWMYMMAMHWFSMNHVQYAVVETGLGGRLDATNVIENSEITLITSIGYDHVQYLGNTLASIAGEKAGIIKKNTPLVFDCSVKEASDVILNKFWQMNPQSTVCHPVSVLNADNLKYGKNNISYDTVVDQKALHIDLSMLGTYQVDNSLLALNGLAVIGRANDYLGLDKDEFYRIIAGSFKNTFWAGRMERIREGFFIDGAHNDAGITALTHTLAVHFSNNDLYLLFAVAEDKDYTKMIRTLCSLKNLKGVMVTAIDNIRRADTKEVATLFEKFGHAPVKQEYNIKEALQTAIEWAGDDVLCCCGSLYLAGSVKEIMAYK